MEVTKDIRKKIILHKTEELVYTYRKFDLEKF